MIIATFTEKIKMRQIVYFSLLMILCSSCINQIDRYLDAKHIKFKKLRAYPEKAGITSSWSVYDNECRLEISIDKRSITEGNYDSADVSLYNLQLVFFDNSGVAKLNPNFSKYYANSTVNKKGYFSLEQTITYSSQHIRSEFTFPMYLFHNIVAGNNKLYMCIVLTQLVGTDKYQLFKGFYSFKIDVPEIYHSELICSGIDLQCDSIWSPYSSDFSFGRGLPDVYWAICIPSADSNDVTNYYASTPVIWNAYGYEHTDTIDIFTYTEDEELLIGVYDYDRVFSDEYIGSWHGRLSELNGKSANSLTFPHVTSFNYEFKPPVLYNIQNKGSLSK